MSVPSGTLTRGRVGWGWADVDTFAGTDAEAEVDSTGVEVGGSVAGGV